MVRIFKITLLIAIIAFARTGAHSQIQVPIKQLLETSTKNYPAIHAAEAQKEASGERVKSARRTLIPEINASAQANYSTYNNLTGMFYPEYILPVSGPPSTENLNDMVWGSAAGLLMKWEPYTFGRRSKKIKAAESSYEASSAINNFTLLEHHVQLSSTYLDYLLAIQILDVLESDQERAEANYGQAVRLANSGLVSGVDTARFHTELSKAKIKILQQQNILHEYETTLSELVATDLPENLMDFYRRARSIDPETRTEMWEFIVNKKKSELNAGLFAEIQLHIQRTGGSMWVPHSAVLTTLRRKAVGKVVDGKLKWVEVKTGMINKSTIEVFGALDTGDHILLQPNEEMIEGMSIN